MKILPKKKRLLGLRIAGKDSVSIGAKSGNKPSKKAIRPKVIQDK